MNIKKILCIAASAFILTACGGTKNVEISSVSEMIYEKVENGEFEMGMLSDNLDADTLKELYNIDADDLEAYDVRMALINVQANEIAMFKAKDGKLDEVKQGVEKRIEDLKNTWSQYLPDQYELVKNYQTYENGNYYFFIVSEYAKDMIDTIKAEFK